MTPSVAPGVSPASARLQQRVTPVALTAFVDRHAIAIAAGLTIAGMSMSALVAHSRPFWHDEIFTILISQLPLAGIWKAATEGVDFAPPLNDLATHLVYRLFGSGHVATRLPAIIGVWAMCGIVFEIVRRRSNATAALAAFMMPFLTPCFKYSYEARGYGLMVALFAVDGLAWSEAARGRRRTLWLPVVALSLAAGIWNHYYAVVAVLPLLAGEVVRLMKTRRADWAMYAAFAAAGLLVLPLWPLVRVITASAASGSERLRSVAFADQLLDTYHFLIAFLLARRFLAILAAVLLLSIWMRVRTGTRGAAIRGSVPAHEVAAGVVCLVMPAAAILIGLVSGEYLARYVLSFVVGLSIVVPLTIWYLSPNTLGERLWALVVAVSFGQLGWQAVSQAPLALEPPLDSHPVLVSHLQQTDPVVLTGVLYLQMWYYAPPEWKPRVQYLADPDAAFQAIRNRTMDVNLLALRKYAPVTVAEYRSFVSQQKPFIVFARREGHWLLQRLERDGGSLTPIGQEYGVPINRVSF